MTSIADFNRYECDLIPGAKVNAYVTPKLNPLNTSELIIDSTWGEGAVDLTPAVKFTETVTHFKLSPEDTPLYLEFDNEAGDRECIYGDDLAKIIPVMKLKDVDDSEEPSGGDALVFDGDTEKFVLFPLLATLESLDTRLTAAEATLQNVQITLANIQSVVNQILTKLTPPADAPSDVKVAFSNMNLYSDSTNNNLKTSGIYSHLLSEDRINDERFA